MKWFKAIPPDHPAMEDLINKLGFEGYGRFLAVYCRCQELNTAVITESMIVKAVNTNRRGAAKLLPMFQESLTKVSANITQSLPNVSPNFDQSLPKVYPNIGESLPKLEGQNPHGSTRDQEENRIDKNRGEESNAPALPSQNLLTDHQPILTFVNSTTKDTVSEVDWMWRNSISLLTSKGSKVRVNMLGDTLGEWCQNNPDAKKMVYGWLKYPPAKRMAAAGYAMKRPGTTNEFDWAFKAIESNWDSYTKLIPACQKMVDEDDYVLEV